MKSMIELNEFVLESEDHKKVKDLYEKGKKLQRRGIDKINKAHKIALEKFPIKIGDTIFYNYAGEDYQHKLEEFDEICFQYEEHIFYFELVNALHGEDVIWIDDLIGYKK